MWGKNILPSSAFAVVFPKTTIRPSCHEPILNWPGDIPASVKMWNSPGLMRCTSLPVSAGSSLRLLRCGIRNFSSSWASKSCKRQSQSLIHYNMSDFSTFVAKMMAERNKKDATENTKAAAKKQWVESWLPRHQLHNLHLLPGLLQPSLPRRLLVLHLLPVVV